MLVNRVNCEGLRDAHVNAASNTATGVSRHADAFLAAGGGDVAEAPVAQRPRR